jgi:hypothetical protein
MTTQMGITVYSPQLTSAWHTGICSKAAFEGNEGRCKSDKDYGENMKHNVILATKRKRWRARAHLVHH